MRTGEDIFGSLLIRARPLVFGSLLLGILATMMGVLLVRGLNAYVEGRGLGLMIIQFTIILVLAAVIRLLQSRFAARSARRMVLEFRARLMRRLVMMPWQHYATLDAAEVRRTVFEGPRTVLQSVRILDNLPPQLAQQVAGIGFIAWLAPELLPLLLTAVVAVAVACVWAFRCAQADERSRAGQEIALAQVCDGVLGNPGALRVNTETVEHDIAPRIKAITAERMAARHWISATLVATELALVFAAAMLIVAGPMIFGADPLLSIVAGFLVLFVRVGVLAEMPKIVRALEIIRAMSAMLARLEHLMVAAPKCAPAPLRPGTLESGLTVEGLCFARADPEGFTLGPLDMTLHTGEITFLVGSNGSGKTTLLRLLTGLHAPDSGGITVDGVPVEPHADTGWIGAVFEDPVLPVRADGRPDFDPVAVAAILTDLGAPGAAAITRWDRGEPDIAVECRRWIALANLLADDRPVLALDDWAAGQGVAAQRWFYTRFLPSMKQRGKTLIIATHDTAYFSSADRMVLLDKGT